MIPSDIRQTGAQTLGIHWEDAHESEYQSDYLRLRCPCAACVDEWTGRAKLKPESIPKDIHPVQIQSTGLYGIKIDWSDRHNTGIYTFKLLRDICPCVECRSQKKGD